MYNNQIFHLCSAILMGAVMFFFIACSDAQKPRWRQMVMTTDLVDDPAVIRMYDSLHSKQGVWPALEKANKAAGIRLVKIWRAGTRLMMMIEVPEDADMARLDALSVSYTHFKLPTILTLRFRVVSLFFTDEMNRAVT